MAGTHVKYNGVTLINCHTKEWSQEIEYDESRTDQVGIKLRAKFSGIVHDQHIVLEAADEPGSGAGAQGVTTSDVMPRVALESAIGGGLSASLREILNRLSTPRGALQITFGFDPAVAGAAVIDIPATHTDIANGPRPSNVSIDHVCSNKVFRISFTVETTYRLATNKCTALVNRWAVEETMDENFAMTRTITGHLRLRDTGNAFEYKGLTVPALEPGFARRQIRFQVDESGLTCSYVVVDKQVKYAAPWPCATMSGRHAVISSDGTTLDEEVSVSVTGDPNADSRDLLARAMQVIEYRLGGLTGIDPDNDQSFITDFQVVESIGEVNQVEATVRRKSTQQYEFKTRLEDVFTKAFNTLTLVKGQYWTDPEGYPAGIAERTYDKQLSVAPNIHGYRPWSGPRNAAVLALFSCYLTPIMDCAQGFPGTSPIGPKPPRRSAPDYQDPNDPGTQVGGAEVPKIPESSTVPTSKSAQLKVYNYYKLAVRHHKKYGVVSLPLATGYTSNANSPTHFLAKLHETSLKHIVTVDAERIGDWPEFPEDKETITSGTLVGRLVESDLEAMPPQLTASGGKLLYSATKRMVYVFNRTVARDEAWTIYRQAYLAESAAPTTVTERDFEYDAETPEGAGGGGGGANAPLFGA